MGRTTGGQICALALLRDVTFASSRPCLRLRTKPIYCFDGGWPIHLIYPPVSITVTGDNNEFQIEIPSGIESDGGPQGKIASLVDEDQEIAAKSVSQLPCGGRSASMGVSNIEKGVELEIEDPLEVHHIDTESVALENPHIAGHGTVPDAAKMTSEAAVNIFVDE